MPPEALDERIPLDHLLLSLTGLRQPVWRIDGQRSEKL